METILDQSWLIGIKTKASQYEVRENEVSEDGDVCVRFYCTKPSNISDRCGEVEVGLVPDLL